MDARQRWATLARHMLALDGPHELRVLALMLTECDTRGVWNGTFAAVAERFSLSWSTVARVFRRLQDAGAVRKIGETPRASIWQICDGTDATSGTLDTYSNPPTPPPTTPTDPSTLGAPTTTSPNGLGGGGGDMSAVICQGRHKRRYVKQPPPHGLTDAEYTQRAALLERVQDPNVRARLARAYDAPTIRAALAIVGEAKNAGGGLIVHVLDTGQATARAAQQRDKAQAAENARARKVEQTRDELRARENAEREADAIRARIERADFAHVREALAVAISTTSTALRGHLARANAGLGMREGVLRAALRGPLRAAVVAHLDTIARGGPRALTDAAAAILEELAP